MAVWKKCISFVVVFLLICLTLWRYYWQEIPGKYKAVFLRCTFIAFNNAFTMICSFFAWKRVSIFIDTCNVQKRPKHKLVTRSHDQYGQDHTTRSKQTVPMVIFCAFVVFGTSSWYMPYFAMFRPSQDAHWVPFCSFICLGFILQFMMCLFFINILKWFRNKYRRHRLGNRVSNERHPSQAREVPIAAIYALMCCMYGLHTTSLPQEIVSVQIPVVGLPKSLDGYRIAQMTDMHLGPTVGRGKLEQVVNIVNTMKADAAVIVGDLVDGPVDTLGDVVKVIKDIKVKGGKYFVTGNHEYYSTDVDEWLVFLRNLGFTVLHNEHIKILDPRSEEFFYMAGTDDVQATQFGYTGHGYDLDKAVSSCDREHPIVLLAHQPRAALRALDSSYNIKLVLSGHTHGGQMFPFTMIVGLFNPFQKGLYQYKDGHVYVSQGTIYWGIPFRIGTFMEITEVTLRAV